MKNFIKTGRHGIFVPKYTDLYAKENLVAEGKMSGHFTLVTHSERYGSRVRADFDNLILDAGLDRFAGAGVILACQVGSGSTAPAVSQTGLASYVAGTGSIQAYSQSYVSGTPDYWQYTYTFRFGTGAAAGNLAEVGVGWSAAGANLFSRALIQDALGNPTSLTILSDEVLDVVYTVRWYPAVNDTVQVVNIGGVDYTFTHRPCQVNQHFGGWGGGDGAEQFLNRFTRLMGGTHVGNNTTNTSPSFPYNVESYEAQTQYTRTQTLPLGGSGAETTFLHTAGTRVIGVRPFFGLNVSNYATGIGAFRWSSGKISSTNGVTEGGTFSAYHSKVEPKIPKNSTQVLTLQFDMTFGRL